MRGKDEAELFYNQEKFKRKGAIPKRIVRSFFGRNSVQTLDKHVHRQRKNMLMSVMTAEKIKQLVNIVKQEWENAIDEWEQKNEIIFYEEIQKLLAKSACRWVGVPLSENKLNKRTKELASLFESATAIGPAYWTGRR